MAVLLFEDTDAREACSPKLPIRRWLAFQTDRADGRYCMHRGRWYRMNREYADIVRRRTREIFDQGPYLRNLPEWTLEQVHGDLDATKRRNSELSYNLGLAKTLGGICLDQKLVYSEAHRRGIEACDVLLEDGTFIHVKHIDASSPASHLLAQALVSTEVLTYDKQAQDHLASRVRELGRNAASFQLKPARVVIVMARERKLLDADSLFTFTQVNLARHVRFLEQHGVQVYIAPILRRALVIGGEQQKIDAL